VIGDGYGRRAKLTRVDQEERIALFLDTAAFDAVFAAAGVEVLKAPVRAGEGQRLRRARHKSSSRESTLVNALIVEALSRPLWNRRSTRR
jgi:hypothetical protein